MIVGRRMGTQAECRNEIRVRKDIGTKVGIIGVGVRVEINVSQNKKHKSKWP